MNLKELLKKAWKWLLAQTDIDEKINEEVHEIVDHYKETKAKLKEVKEEVEHRVERVKEEVSDVVEAAQKVKNQIDDIKGAVKGETRKGRKPAKTNTKKSNTNTTKPVAKKPRTPKK